MLDNFKSIFANSVLEFANYTQVNNLHCTQEQDLKMIHDIASLPFFCRFPDLFIGNRNQK